MGIIIWNKGSKPDLVYPTFTSVATKAISLLQSRYILFMALGCCVKGRSTQNVILTHQSYFISDRVDLLNRYTHAWFFRSQLKFERGLFQCKLTQVIDIHKINSNKIWHSLVLPYQCHLVDEFCIISGASHEVSLSSLN